MSSPAERLWLDRAQLERFQARLIERFGGPQGLRDAAALESALARPQQHERYAQPDLWTLAAALAHGLVKNHAFVDGNKRIAYSATKVFLGLNGQLLQPTVREAVDAVVGLASGALDEEAFARWLRANASAIEPQPPQP